jgi:hypothetical protein
MSALCHKRTQPARAVLSSIARLLLPQLPSATFGAAGSGSSVALATGLDNYDGDRHLYVEAGGQKHTQWLAPVSRAASPYPFPVIVPNRAYCDGVRRYSMKLAPSALSLR